MSSFCDEEHKCITKTNELGVCSNEVDRIQWFVQVA